MGFHIDLVNSLSHVKSSHIKCICSLTLSGQQLLGNTLLISGKFLFFKKHIKLIKSHINYILFIMVETTNILNKVPICDMDV